MEIVSLLLILIAVDGLLPAVQWTTWDSRFQNFKNIYVFKNGYAYLYKSIVENVITKKTL